MMLAQIPDIGTVSGRAAPAAAVKERSRLLIYVTVVLTGCIRRLLGACDRNEHGEWLRGGAAHYGCTYGGTAVAARAAARQTSAAYTARKSDKWTRQVLTLHRNLISLELLEASSFATCALKCFL